MFRENYIEVEPSVAIALGVDKFYANSLTINEFDEIFNLELDEFEEKVSSCTHSVQQSIGMRAIKLIENGTLDNGKTKEQSCELDPILHPEILQRAVELAILEYQQRIEVLDPVITDENIIAAAHFVTESEAKEDVLENPENTNDTANDTSLFSSFS